jgi:hypothetical protein
LGLCQDIIQPPLDLGPPGTFLKDDALLFLVLVTEIDAELAVVVEPSEGLLGDEVVDRGLPAQELVTEERRGPLWDGEEGISAPTL